MAPTQQSRMQPVQALMPHHEEYAVANTDSQVKKGRREIMGSFARAAALGAVAVATKDRAALADEEVGEDAVPPPPSKAEIFRGNLGKLAALPVVAAGWALSNILIGDQAGPFAQLAAMSEEKERKQAGGAKGKKRR